MTILKILQSSQ